EERGGRSRDERQAGAQWCCVRGGRAHGGSARARLSAREPRLYPFGEMTAFSAALRRRADEALAGRLYVEVRNARGHRDTTTRIGVQVRRARRYLPHRLDRALVHDDVAEHDVRPPWRTTAPQ